jgi:hypothetical protein
VPVRHREKRKAASGTEGRKGGRQKLKGDPSQESHQTLKQERKKEQRKRREEEEAPLAKQIALNPNWIVEERGSKSWKIIPNS